MSSILIVEDEFAINKMLCMNLGLIGYETIPMSDGQQVMDWLEGGGRADLALVDIMMPKVDGFALLEPMRENNIPVIFLTAKADLDSKLKGLLGGAEDYIVKPFEMLELLARISKVLERHDKLDSIINIDKIHIDTKKRSVFSQEGEISLTLMEYKLLLLLAKNRNVALSREKLLSEIWGVYYVGGTRTVDVHIAQLRKKTGLRIINIPKVGYRLEAQE